MFTESQAYCYRKKSYFYKDAVYEILGKVEIISFSSTKSARDSATQRDFDRSESFPFYAAIVRNIARWQLSFDSDALNACTGIFKVDQGHRAARGETAGFAFGLPVSIFTKALCWMSTKASPGRRRSEFPSWTCAGWDTAAPYDDLENRQCTVLSHFHPSMQSQPETLKTTALVGPRPVRLLDPTCPLLTFWTTSATLRVDRTGHSPKLPNTFAIRSPHDPDLCLGHIPLAESTWASRPDEMKFIAIGIERHEDRKNPGEYSCAVKLLCIEWIGDVVQRVQLTYRLAEQLIQGRARRVWQIGGRLGRGRS